MEAQANWVSGERLVRMEPYKPDFLQLNACCAENATGIRNDTLILQATWVSVLKGTLFFLITFGAVFGNSLVILSVYIKRKLRTITNCFVVSLATSDLLVGILILPLGTKLGVTGVWDMGTVLCDVWLFCDVMLCTASILNLCCISLDRFFAITNPLIYATKRSKRLALLMIGLAWVASVVVTCPLIFGSHEERCGQDVLCELTMNPGYVIYSSLGAFYIPLFVIVCVYARIFQAIRQRDNYWHRTVPHTCLASHVLYCAGSASRLAAAHHVTQGVPRGVPPPHWLPP